MLGTANDDVQKKFDSLTKEEKIEALNNYRPTFYETPIEGMVREPDSMEILNTILLQEEINVCSKNTFKLSGLEFLYNKIGRMEFNSSIFNNYLNIFIQEKFLYVKILKRLRSNSSYSTDDLENIVHSFIKKIEQVYIIEYVKKFGYDKFIKSLGICPVKLTLDRGTIVEKRIKKEAKRKKNNKIDIELRSYLKKQGLMDISIPDVSKVRTSSRSKVKLFPDLIPSITKYLSIIQANGYTENSLGILSDYKARQIYVPQSITYVDKCIDAAYACRELVKLQPLITANYEECKKCLATEGYVVDALFYDRDKFLSRAKGLVQDFNKAIFIRYNQRPSFLTNDEIETDEERKATRLEYIRDFINSVYNYELVTAE